MSYDQTLDLVRKEMEVMPGTPEQLFEERVQRLVNESVEIAMLALDPEQRPLVKREARGLAQILLRMRFILSTLEGEEVEQIRRLIVALEYPQRPVGLRVVQ
jgi:hypothetical protein